ncbi:MAG TPA: hypothetical protein VHW73_10140 [Rudaea sp.]|jgi:hypothetical protein|nr:hypothetical protein [Rudaea sp.]
MAKKITAYFAVRASLRVPTMAEKLQHTVKQKSDAVQPRDDSGISA